MSLHRVPLAALTAIALLAACAGPTTTKPDGGGARPSAKPSGIANLAASPSAAPARQGVPVAGIAIAPAGIVAAGAGNVIVDNAGNMVAAGAGNIVGPNGGQLGPARGLLAVDQQPLAGAEVFLAGPDGQPLPDIPPVRTDAQGRFRLDGAPASETVTVQVRVKNQAGVATTLVTLVRPTAAGATANVSIGTTCVAVAVLDGQGGNLGAFNPAKFQVAVDTTDKELTPGTWPDPADRQAILAAMSRLEAKIDLLQSTLEEIREELRQLRNEVAGGASPAASVAPSVAPSAAAGAGASTPPAAATATDLAFRAQLTGAGDENLRVVLVEGDSDAGRTLGDDDGDVGAGFQIRVDRAAFPATFRAYALPDAGDPDPAAVRASAANLLGVVTLAGLGPDKATFVPRAGAVVGLAKARLSPYFEPLDQPAAYSGHISWEPDDEAEPVPPGPFGVEVATDAGSNWSGATAFSQEATLKLDGVLAIAPVVKEIPARFLVKVRWTDAGGAARSVDAGYVRVYRDYVTDEVRTRFDHDARSPWDFDQ